MAQQISLYIQQDSVQVVHATNRQRQIAVTKTETFPLEDLAVFLRQSRLREFTVTMDFATSNEETIHIPPVKKSMVRPLLHSKLKKARSSKEDYTFSFYRTGQKTVEGKPLDEYFVLSVETAEVDELAGRFLSRKKEFTHLYADIAAVLKMLPMTETPYIFLYEAGGRKHFLLIRSGKILFTRSMQALNEGLTDYDIQNVNMTVNYCRQTPRLDPEKAICVGDPSLLAGTSVEPSVPIEFLEIPANIRVDRPVFDEYLVPISALGNMPAPDFFSPQYAYLHRLLRFMRTSRRVFAAAAAVFVLLFALYARQAVGMKKELVALRSDTGNLQSLLAEFNDARKHHEKVESLVRFMKEKTGKSTSARFLRRLADVDASRVDIRTFELQRQDDSLEFRMEGTARAKSLFQDQRELDRAVAVLEKTAGIRDASGDLSVKDNTFRITGWYDDPR